MGDDPFDPPHHQRRDLRWRPIALDEAVHERRGRSAEHRLLTTSQYGGQVGGREAWSPVPCAVHAAVLAMKEAFVDPPPHPVLAQPSVKQLRQRDDAVLRGGDPRQLLLR